MSFKKGFSKPVTASSPKHASSPIATGFNFKKLEEEDDDDEALFAYTGKYEKLIEDSQKAQKKTHERTSSVSSVSSTSSIAGEIILPLKTNFEGMVENFKLSFLPNETTSSSLKSAALAKLETSKDLFSGLKGKITDRISRTIEEFSGDSSSNSSPEKEKAKLVPLHSNNSNGPVEEEMDKVFQVTASFTEPVSSAPASENAVINELQDKSILSLAHSESSLLLPETSPSVKGIPVNYSIKNGTLSHNKTTGISNFTSSDFGENHPLAKSDLDDDFDGVLNPPENEFLSKNIEDADDSSEYNPYYMTTNASTLGSEKVASEPQDLTGDPVFLTDVQLSSSSKIKHPFPVNKNESKASTFATRSNLHSYNDEHLALPLEDQSKTACNKQEPYTSEQCEKNSTKDKSNPVPSKSATSLILQQLNLEDWVLPYQKLITVAVVLFTFLIIPLPSYISGFIMGTLLASLGWALYIWLIEQPRLPEPLILPQMFEPPPVPELKVTVEGDEFLYKGWMNELTDYNADDYHINKTLSIFVSLEGSHLRMQRSKNAIPKRALWDEVLPKPHFIHQRHFDLTGSKVFLLPHGLVKKRIWSKKYPICVAVADRNSNGDVKLRHISSEPLMAEKDAKLSEMGFEYVTEEKCGQNVLYLFARTGREKEEWFKRFFAAACSKPLGNHVLEMKRALSQSSVALKKSLESTPKHKRQGSTGFVHSSSSESLSEPSSQKVESLDLLTFAHYMGRLMPSGSLSSGSSPTHKSTSKDVGKSSIAKETSTNTHSRDLNEAKVLSPGSSIFCDSQMFWINALIGRCFFDFLRDKWWISKVQEKLQRKLSKIHVPYFIEELQVTGINMGCEVPGIRRAGKPYMDEQGFWVDLDITYAGGFQMTIETKINLMKLKKTPHLSTHLGHSVGNLKSPVTDSDEEDSAESSTDEEEEAPSNSEENSSGGGASKKLLRYLNKITQSKYFQQATEYRVIKRAMENVSNTPLTLTVTVISLVGKLAVNIPPPPSDRLWYGFRGNPHLRLSAKPQVGERAVTITHIVEWIEKKLATEFQRVFVMPNMDDLIIPILVPGEMNDTAMTRSASV